MRRIVATPLALMGLLACLTGCSPAIVGAVAVSGYDEATDTLKLVLVVCEGSIDTLYVADESPASSISGDGAGWAEDRELPIDAVSRGQSIIAATEMRVPTDGHTFAVYGYGHNGNFFFPYPARTAQVTGVSRELIEALGPDEVLSNDGWFGGDAVPMRRDDFVEKTCDE